MPAMFDPSLYSTVPSRTPGASLSLARGLLSAAPPEPEPPVAKRLAKVRKAAKLLQVVWVEAGRPNATASDVRPLDVALDRSWSCLRARLDAAVQLGDDDHAPRANVLVQALFPTGLDFLKLPYAEEWAESERRLTMIKRDELAAELEALAGKPYLPAVKKAHAAYGAALGITDKKAAAVGAVRVVEPLRDLQAAIGSYVRTVVGLCDEDDAASVAAVQEQLEPLLRARRSRASGAAEADAEEPIEAPLPAMPTGAAASAEA